MNSRTEQQSILYAANAATAKANHDECIAAILRSLRVEQVRSPVQVVAVMRGQA